MLDSYMDQCAPDAAFMDVGSLNRRLDVYGEQSETLEIIDSLPDLSADIERDVEAIEKVAVVSAFLATLSPRQVDVARRYFWLDQSQQEIAHHLNVTPSAVSHAVRAIIRAGRRHFGITEH